MNTTCPQCGHKFAPPHDQQRAAGKARWKGVSKRQRSEAGRAAVLKRWAKSPPVSK